MSGHAVAAVRDNDPAQSTVTANKRKFDFFM
jgi:hypothetical protein